MSRSEILASPSGLFASAQRPVILFVAGDEDALLAYHALARSEGFGSELARDRHEGLLLANLARPDLIVVEVRELQREGAWIVRRLRAGAGTRTVPIVLAGAAGDALLDTKRPAGGRIGTLNPADHQRCCASSDASLRRSSRRVAPKTSDVRRGRGDKQTHEGVDASFLE